MAIVRITVGSNGTLEVAVIEASSEREARLALRQVQRELGDGLVFGEPERHRHEPPTAASRSATS